MKKSILHLSTIIVIAVSAIYLTSCGSNAEHDHDHDHENHVEEHADDHDHGDHEHSVAYQCPMLCEGDKIYAEAGSCPECGMDLEEIELTSQEGEDLSEESEGHDHDESEHNHDEEGEVHDHDEEGHEH